MKKQILRITIIFSLFVVLVPASFAQTKTPTGAEKSVTPKPTSARQSLTPAKTEPTSTESAEINRIQKIKDMVASRVAQLKLVEKRGILGTVKEVSSTQITVKDNKGEQREIDIDELTKFQGKTSSKDDEDSDSFGISDIDEGDEVSFVGLYNKQTDRLLARVVMLPKSIPIHMDGVIGDVDESEGTFSIANDDEKRIVDYEKSTTAQLYSKEDGSKKSGFSQIEDGQRALVVGFEDPDNKHIIATRILHFVDVPPSAEMKKGISKEAIEEEATPSAKVTKRAETRTSTTVSPTPTKKTVQ